MVGAAVVLLGGYEQQEFFRTLSKSRVVVAKALLKILQCVLLQKLVRSIDKDVFVLVQSCFEERNALDHDLENFVLKGFMGCEAPGFECIDPFWLL